jgi:transcription-repair coupling factor (superfamily II helicase)
LNRVAKTPAAQSLARRLEQGGALSCPGVAAPAQPFFTALLRQFFPSRPLLVVTDHRKTQELFHQDLAVWLPAEHGRPRNAHDDTTPVARPPAASNALFYPAWEVLPHEGRLPHADVIAERLETLVALLPRANEKRPPPDARLVVTNVTALLQKTFTPADLGQRIRPLTRGDRLDPLDLVEWLEAQGYEPEAQVTQKGEIALRGGIVDVFPPTNPWPVRLEFFGDELESLREFDPLTQISRGEVAQVILPPAGELGLLRRGLRNVDDAAEGLSSATLLDHLPPETIIVWCEPELLAERAAAYSQQIPAGDPFFISWPAVRTACEQRGWTQIALTDSGTDPMRPAPNDAPPPDDAAEEFSLTSLEAFRPLGERAPEPPVAEAQRREFFNQLHRWRRQGYTVHVFCNNDGERQRFREIWAELGFDETASATTGTGEQSRGDTETPADNASLPPPDPLEASLTTDIGTLTRGFLCEAAKLVVVTDAEIFGRYRVPRPRRLKSPHAAALRSALEIDFADWEEGDLVVHLQHGIGRYLGLKMLPATTRGPASAPPHPPPAIECLMIEYAAREPGGEPPKLYVPVSEAHLVGKYVGAGKMRPPLNTLGGARWKKAKEHAERAVRDVAAELLQIQAAREARPGYAFQPDAPWQREFESAFIFEETPDQVRAIAETKADMERPKPMDRLICGDVGFGKTEVAIRAAFKAVLEGKQVAVLVPTTVLAQQHYNTFRERLADYPVRVELLSRFRTRRAQQRVVRDLAVGAVDIVIGTHRLIQSDIGFKDLGLVVIDEEQRFGVWHKEKFKRLRTQVDVLTLSATPIPRTLYLALTGARDMSAIQTPPQDRLPVETIVSPYDERVIRDAIQRELNRGGQVFFLHNRVMTIETMRTKLQQLVPHARIVVGHGQMPDDDLEAVMTQFVNGEADVLLSTTIIESGLDIPNANTIIIDRADRFGLSDLYQLRGRVGRYKHQAYAYLLLPRHARLLTDVRKRISAMRQYATLGSGFKIAMRDLEIRGAGNLLGAEQSGHITAVGFELYCQLLQQSIRALKGEPVSPRIDVAVRLDFLELAETPDPAPTPDAPGKQMRPVPKTDGANDRRGSRQNVRPAFAALPQAYVPEPRHRIEIYRKLAQVTDKAGLDALAGELRDRFGPPPGPVTLLLMVAELKLLAAAKAVTRIEVEDDKLKLTRYGELMLVGNRFPRLTRKNASARLKEIKRLLLTL